MQGPSLSEDCSRGHRKRACNQRQWIEFHSGRPMNRIHVAQRIDLKAVRCRLAPSVSVVKGVSFWVTPSPKVVTFRFSSLERLTPLNTSSSSNLVF
jgi:hypothetical protein